MEWTTIALIAIVVVAVLGISWFVFAAVAVSRLKKIQREIWDDFDKGSDGSFFKK